MKVLGKNVLVLPMKDKNDSVLKVQKNRNRGTVLNIGNEAKDELTKGDEIIFGKDYDELEIEIPESKIKSVLIMKVDNIKVVL